MQVFAEVRSALKYLRRRLVFAVAVAATLAAGIAVATTAYGVARAVLWRPLPFADAARLVFVWEAIDSDGQVRAARVTGARYAAWREAAGDVGSLALFGATGFSVESPSGTSTVRGVRVSVNYFDTLGIGASLGRTFALHDGQPGSERVVVVSDALWRERLGARPDAVGQMLRLNGGLYRIVGVMPPVSFPAWPVNPAIVTLDGDSCQLWVPIASTAALGQSARAHVFGVLGRLAPGVSVAQAADRLAVTASSEAPDPHGVRLQGLREQFVSDARAPLLSLTAAALVVLVIACANLASLYASAFEARRTELAVRAALGAGVPRLVRQLALEAVLLAFVGMASGLAAARVALALVPSVLPASIPLLTPPRVDLQAGLFAATLAAAASVIFTAWPVVRLVTQAPMPRGVAVQSRGLVYRILVVSQVGLTMALVPAAGRLAQSLRSVERQDPGFSIDNVLVADVGLSLGRTATAPEIARAEQALLSAVALRPQIDAVATAYDHPLEANWSENPTVDGDVAADARQRQAELRIVSPEYFEALSVTVLAGRGFSDRDTFDAPGVALVNEAFARELGGHILGRRIRSGTPRFTFGNAVPADFEVVGIVGNERFRGLERPAQPAFYLSTRQFPQTSVTLLARTAGRSLDVVADVRAAIHAVDTRITFDRATTLDTILGEQLAARRVTTTVIGGFALAALCLSGLGMYGLLTVLVGSRRHEVGVRLAIGASPWWVARHVIADGLRTASLGLALGAALSIVTSRLIEHLLVDVSRNDAPTLAVSVALLLAVATLATLHPALRASRIDPATVLRGE